MSTRKMGLLRSLTSAAVFLVAPAGMVAQPAPAAAAPAVHERPKEFGLQDRITVISATSFFPSCREHQDRCLYQSISPSFGRYAPLFVVSDPIHYYATLDVPAGAVIDSIGLNSTTDRDHIFTTRLLQRDYQANVETLASVTSTVHGWNTDYSDPLSISVTGQLQRELVVEVELSPYDDGGSTFEYFAWVEVHWHRTVSPPPATASFNDVPTDHPFFQFIEALKASGITGGCGDGTTYCPDRPLTRGQMAVFLSKALGLHWPD